MHAVHISSDELTCQSSTLCLSPFQWLDAVDDEELKTHLHIFHAHKEEDMEEFSHRYDNIRLEIEDPRACFDLLMNTVNNTIAEPYFVSILQHLLSIRDDMYARSVACYLID